MMNIVIADDSAFLRQLLTDILEKTKKIKIVAAAKNGKEAIEFIKQHKPQMAIFDCEMPVMNGLEALRRVMSECPLPVMMFSSLTSEGASVTIKALEYGAVDFLLKPTSMSGGLSEVAETLIKKIETIVVKNRFTALSGSPKKVLKKSTSSLDSVPTKKIDLIVLGSSTGGVQAAMEVIPKLPENMPPVVWVQHMPEHFTKSFADRLDGVSQMKVKEAKDGELIEPGNVYLGRGGIQMTVNKFGTQFKVQLKGNDKVGGFCPACNVLFKSVGQYFSNNVLGVILTGMGNDGTEGLSELHQKGAYVIGQDEASCVVYGMPRAAFEAGAVDIQFNIEDVAAAMAKVCGV